MADTQTHVICMDVAWIANVVACWGCRARQRASEHLPGVVVQMSEDEISIVCLSDSDDDSTHGVTVQASEPAPRSVQVHIGRCHARTP